MSLQPGEAVGRFALPFRPRGARPKSPVYTSLPGYEVFRYVLSLHAGHIGAHYRI